MVLRILLAEWTSIKFSQEMGKMSFRNIRFATSGVKWQGLSCSILFPWECLFQIGWICWSMMYWGAIQEKRVWKRRLWSTVHLHTDNTLSVIFSQQCRYHMEDAMLSSAWISWYWEVYCTWPSPITELQCHEMKHSSFMCGWWPPFLHKHYHCSWAMVFSVWSKTNCKFSRCISPTSPCEMKCH